MITEESYTVSPSWSIPYSRVQIAHRNVLIYQSGIGKVQASTSALALGLHLPLESLWSLGTAGLLTACASPLIVCQQVSPHDVELTTPFYTLKRFPRTPGLWEADALLLQQFTQYSQAKCLSYCQGLWISGDQSITHQATKTRLQRHWPTAIAVDMESAAIAQVAHSLNLPFFGLRMGCDEAQESAPRDFLQKVPSLMTQLARTIRGFFLFLAGKV